MKNLWNKKFLLGLSCGFLFSFLLVVALREPAPDIEAEARKMGMLYQSELPKHTIEPYQKPVPEESPREPVQEEPPSREVIVEIPRGSTGAQIIQILAQHGVISDSEEFHRLVNLNKLADKFHTGSFTLSSGDDLLAVLAKLTKREIEDLQD